MDSASVAHLGKYKDVARVLLEAGADPALGTYGDKYLTKYYGNGDCLGLLR